MQFGLQVLIIPEFVKNKNENRNSVQDNKKVFSMNLNHGAHLGQGAAWNMTMQLILFYIIILKELMTGIFFYIFKDDDQCPFDINGIACVYII